MKTQSLYKKLSLPLLLTVISTTGIGITPARSVSLTQSQGIVIAQKPDNRIMKNQRYKPVCTQDIRPPHCVPPNSPAGINYPREEGSTIEDNPSNVIMEPPSKPVLYRGKPVCDPPKIVPPYCVPPNSPARQGEQHDIEQPQEQSSPTAEPLPQN